MQKTGRDLFEEIIGKIKAEDASRENKRGWRFLTTSRDTLINNSGILLVTLNPGGEKAKEGHDRDSCENGCAYLKETWGKAKEPGMSVLQKQIQGIFREVAQRWHKNYGDYVGLMESSTCGNFIPFRSPSYKELEEKKKAIDFSKTIWREIISQNDFKLIICIDKVTFKSMNDILSTNGFERKSCENLPTGWGEYKATIRRYSNKEKTISLVKFPHLSRFSIFGREKSKKDIKNIFDIMLVDNGR